jgi:hypothetical protein
MNWEYVEDDDGNVKFQFLVLREYLYERDPEDQFVQLEIEQLRLLELDEEGNVTIQIWRKGEVKENFWIKYGELKYLEIRGVKEKEIPFQFFGCIANTPVPTKPPLIDLMNTNIQHWKLNVDYNHGLHFCALPTPWAAGFNVKEGESLYVGVTKAWHSDEPTAKCGYLEFTGRGLEAIEKAMGNVEKRMAVLGARLLEEPKKSVEAAETIKVKAMGDTATLSTIVGCTESGLLNLIEKVQKWLAATGKVSVDINKDFVSTKLSPQELDSLVKALQGGHISQDTFLHNLKIGEIIPEDVSIEDEKNKIEVELNNKDFTGAEGSQGLNIISN